MVYENSVLYDGSQIFSYVWGTQLAIQNSPKKCDAATCSRLVGDAETAIIVNSVVKCYKHVVQAHP